jgi:hypothetical protein
LRTSGTFLTLGWHMEHMFHIVVYIRKGSVSSPIIRNNENTITIVAQRQPPDPVAHTTDQEHHEPEDAVSQNP